MFTPIQEAAQLPQVGEATERFFLDLKRAYEKKSFPDSKKERFDHREMAKDVAAFANASGGTIVVGAIENQATGAVAKYEPLLKKLAKEPSAAFNDATRDRCSPRPVLRRAVDPDGERHRPRRQRLALLGATGGRDLKATQQRMARASRATCSR